LTDNSFFYDAQVIHYRIVLLHFGKVLHRNHVDEDDFMEMVATCSRNSRNGADDALVLSRAVRLGTLVVVMDG